MLRLSATGTDAQIDMCLAALSDKAQTGKLASLVEWRPTPAYADFLALPMQIMYCWNDDDTVYVAGKEASRALELFLDQRLHFEQDEGSVWKCQFATAEEHEAIMEKLLKLTLKWGFYLENGTKPDWLDQA